MTSIEKTRNFAIIAHVDHGKTTLADTLVAMGKVISQQSAAKKRFLDNDKVEIQRGITILSAGITIEVEDYTYNIIDCPGHADFSAEVAKSLRAVDGVLVLMDIVEGIMPQGESVLRQAIKLKIQPILFINKIDRLFTELQNDLEQIKQRLGTLVQNVNILVSEICNHKFDYIKPFSFKQGNIIVGSGLYKFAVNPAVSSINLKDIKQIYDKKLGDTLSQRAPLKLILSATINKCLPNPAIAQANKFEDSEFQYLKTCNPRGPVVAIVTSIKYQQQSKIIQIRLFSGTLRKGLFLYCNNEELVRVNRVCKMYGKVIKQIESAESGQICNISGNFENIQIGTTLSEEKDFPIFEPISAISEPVISISFRPKQESDLVKLKQIVKQACIQDNTLRYAYIQQTQEHILSGIGKLQLEIVLNRIVDERGIPLKLEKPSVIYRETITEETEDAEVVTSNKLNKFKLAVFPLPEPVIELLKTTTNILKMPDFKLKLINAGLPMSLAKRILHQEGANLFINDTKGVQFMQQTAPNLILGFKKFISVGPILGKPVVGVGVKLTDATFHCDFVHRTPADIAPPTTRLLNERMLLAKPKILEPYLKANITIPTDKLTPITRQLSKRRAKIVDMVYQTAGVTVIALAPINECSDLAESLMSAAEGRLNWCYQLEGYQFMPEHILGQIKQNR